MELESRRPIAVRIDRRWATIPTAAGVVRMHARAALGDAPAGALPVVLVHGWAASSRYMLPLARRLADRHPAWAVDLPGHGPSETPARVLTIAEEADALAEWMTAAGIARAALVGNSAGTQVSVQLAVRHPERAAALVLVSPTVDPARRTLAEQGAALLVDTVRERPSLVALELLDLLRVGPLRMLGMARAALDDAVEEALPRVRCPVLVVRGDRDPLVAEGWAREVVRLLPAGELVTLPGAPHAAHYHQPEIVARRAGDFLAMSGVRPSREAGASG